MNLAQMWNPEAETLPRSQLLIIQRERLRRLVDQLSDAGGHWSQLFASANIDGECIADAEDLARLPLANPCERYANPVVEAQEIHLTRFEGCPSMAIPYSHSDVRQWAHSIARGLFMAGVHPGDLVHVVGDHQHPVTMLGYQHGVRLAKLRIMDSVDNGEALNLKNALEFKARILATSAEKALALARFATRTGVDELPYRSVVLGGRMPSEEVRGEIAEGLGVPVTSFYNPEQSGYVGPIGAQCPRTGQIHVWEDHYIVEIVGSGDKLLPDGAAGELVITSMTRQALPAIRLRTGEKCRIVSRDPCECGRTHLRLERL